MKTVVRANIGRGFKADKLEKMVASNNLLQLWVGDREDFEKNLDEVRAILGNKTSNIVSLYGPDYAKKSSSLFEDTVSIASTIEDTFDVELSSITTVKDSHVEELCDFYQGQTAINVDKQPCRCYGIHEGEDPFSMAMYVANMRSVSCCTDLGMVMDINRLPAVWMNDNIITPLLDYVGELQYQVKKNITPVQVDELRSYLSSFVTAKFQLVLQY